MATGREPVRPRLRTGLPTDHAAGVRELRKTLLPAPRRVEKGDNPRTVFPAP